MVPLDQSSNRESTVKSRKSFKSVPSWYIFSRYSLSKKASRNKSRKKPFDYLIHRSEESRRTQRGSLQTFVRSHKISFRFTRILSLLAKSENQNCDYLE